jgi:hypothetical protein
MLQLTLPPNRNPSIQAYARATSLPVGGLVPGFVVPLRSTLYDFDIDFLANGDYVVDILNPYGRFLLRKRNDDYLIAIEWWQLDCCGNSKDPGKVLVNQDYGGSGALIYCLDGIPIADATIEAFLYSDYIAGNQDARYRIANSRQTASGEWAMPFYLDPDIYVFRFYRIGVAGPDAYRVVVTFDPNDISITPINPVPGLAVLGFKTIPVEPEIVTYSEVKISKLTPAAKEEFFPSVEIVEQQIEIPVVQEEETPPGTVKVNQNFGGFNSLAYKLRGNPIPGAIIKIFEAANFSPDSVDTLTPIAVIKQNAMGVWDKSVFLAPGIYALYCFKEFVAGPDFFNITVE